MVKEGIIGAEMVFSAGDDPLEIPSPVFFFFVFIIKIPPVPSSGAIINSTLERRTYDPWNKKQKKKKRRKKSVLCTFVSGACDFIKETIGGR